MWPFCLDLLCPTVWRQPPCVCLRECQKWNDYSAIHLDPSTVYIVDAQSALDHLIRESTGGHCRRTAQELLCHSLEHAAKCRSVPHDSMVADALTKRHGHSLTMLKFLKTGHLSIVDEDKELADRRQFREVHGRNPRPHRQHEDKSW